MELADGKRDVVDPEVRAYVSSLVTAVSSMHCSSFGPLTRSSLEEVVPMKMADTCLVTMLWHVSGILRNGSSFTTKRRIGWM
jgi:hypothetical protein